MTHHLYYILLNQFANILLGVFVSRVVHWSGHLFFAVSFFCLDAEWRRFPQASWTCFFLGYIRGGIAWHSYCFFFTCLVIYVLEAIWACPLLCRTQRNSIHYKFPSCNTWRVIQVACSWENSWWLVSLRELFYFI